MGAKKQGKKGVSGKGARENRGKEKKDIFRKRPDQDATKKE